MKKIKLSLLSNTAILTVASSISNLCLAGFFMSTLSGTETLAADCIVTGDTVTCNPGDVYVPANHGNKPINDYQTVIYNRAGNDEHGYVQFSNYKKFNDVIIDTKGNQADGVRLRNWGPVVEFENLKITTSGSSADGINLGRDNTNGRVIVWGNTDITTKAGIGVRSTSTEHENSGAHIITLHGSSNITTFGSGSTDTGHGVYAGTQLSGCGVFFQCKSFSTGDVYLLGNDSAVHQITTNGSRAYALYSAGRGSIVANNIDIVTNGNAAHGIVASRTSATYYYSPDQSFGVQDFSGSVDLQGNVTVTVNNTGAFAFLADSHSSYDGADSEGKIATIRSFNNDTNQIVSDKIYIVNGNMLARNSGIINLWMADGSIFTGSTWINDNGVLDINIAGGNSVWNLTEGAMLNSLVLNGGARLSPVGDGINPTQISLAGQVTSLGGVINLTDHSLVGDQLTLQGDYIGGNGALLIIDTFLGGGGSPSDHLIVDGGTVTGQTLVRIKNADTRAPEDQGDATEPSHGIKILRSINGGTTTDDAFALDGSAGNAYQFEGRTVVGAGAYAYSLYKGPNPANSSLDDDYQHTDLQHDWYLRSQHNGGDHFTGGIPLYEAYPQFLHGMNGLSTLQQRIGNRYWSNAGNVALAQGADTVDIYAPIAETGVLIEESGIWGRVEGAHTKINSRASTSDTDYKYNTFKIQAGLDGLLHEAEDAKLIGSITAHYTHGKANIYSTHGNGDIKTNGYGFGGALTWYGENGFYVDNQAQLTWYDSDLNSDLINRPLVSGNNGFGYALSVEAGKNITLNEHWSVKPQAQLIYSNVRFDRFTDQFDGYISRNKADSLQGRLGISADYVNSWLSDQGKTNRSIVYGIANLYNEFRNGTKVDVSGVSFANERERLWAGLGFGGSYNWNDDKYSIYGEGSVNSSLKNFGDSYSYKGTVGFRAKW